MNKKEIFKKIGGIISELTEQYQYLSDNLDHLDPLELELFAANSSFLTDHVEILKKLNAATAGSTQPVAPSSISASPTESLDVSRSVPEDKVEVPPVKISPVAEDEKEQFDFEKHSQAPERLYDRKLTEEEQAVISRKAAEQQQGTAENIPAGVPAVSQEKAEPVEKVEVKEVVIPEKQVSIEAPKPEPAAEKLPVPTVNDLISAQLNPGSSPAAVSRQPVSDLKSIISLNDKLLFIRELFNGYSLAYSEAIEILNRFDSLEAAENFLNINYAEKNHWAAKTVTVEKFYEILRRRYA